MNRNVKLLDVVVLRPVEDEGNTKWIVIEEIPMIVIRSGKRRKYSNYEICSNSFGTRLQVSKSRLLKRVGCLSIEEGLSHSVEVVRKAALRVSNVS